MALLEVADLSVEFMSPGRPLRAVDQVSFVLEEGEILGIVGESGSGKTVACRSILHLLPSSRARIASGSAMFERRDLLALPETGMDEAYVDRLLTQVRTSPLAHVLLFAQDGRYDGDGRLDRERTQAYCPNEWLFAVCKRDARLLPHLSRFLGGLHGNVREFLGARQLMHGRIGDKYRLAARQQHGEAEDAPIRARVDDAADTVAIRRRWRYRRLCRRS